jgi:hypothetical protein
MSTITFSNVDEELLNTQRMALVETIWSDPNHILWGLVNLLDSWYDETFPPEEM